MSFISWQYPLFLGLITAAYWALPLRGRWWLLLVGSYAFYAVWDVRFVALLLTSTVIDYFCGRAIAGECRSARPVFLASLLPLLWLGVCRLVPHLITGLTFPEVPALGWKAAIAFPILFPTLHAWCAQTSEGRRKKLFLLLSVVTNLGVLGFFKYFSFFADGMQRLLESVGMVWSLTIPQVVLPIAISFYTFQSISYAVDLYRGKAHPARDFVLFAAYLAFFPQLVAGPIERAGRFLPQFETPRVWNSEHLHQGLRLLLVGLLKKVFVADNCALVANHVFDPRTPLDPGWALLGVVAFAFQIYGDFSGYTDLARGSARLLGIELSSNFRFPYFATGPSDFWQRWHITLSTWFRDYVYIPLGGNRVGEGRVLANLWITMLLAGLWHGASWTFLLWGGYHAFLLSVYRMVPALSRLESHAKAEGWGRCVMAVGVLFLFTLVGWATFRCTDLAELSHWFSGWTRFGAIDPRSLIRPAAWILLHILPLLLWQWATAEKRDESEIDSWSWPVRGLAYLAVILLVACSTAGDQEFIYFQF